MCKVSGTWDGTAPPVSTAAARILGRPHPGRPRLAMWGWLLLWGSSLNPAQPPSLSPSLCPADSSNWCPGGGLRSTSLPRVQEASWECAQSQRDLGKESCMGKPSGDGGGGAQGPQQGPPATLGTDAPGLAAPGSAASTPVHFHIISASFLCGGICCEAAWHWDLWAGDTCPFPLWGLGQMPSLLQARSPPSRSLGLEGNLCSMYSGFCCE